MQMNQRIYSVRHKRIGCILLGVLFGILFLAVAALFLGSGSMVRLLWMMASAFLLLSGFPETVTFCLLPLLFYGPEAADHVASILDSKPITDGISTVLGMIGIVSFALTYINAARSRKIQGILFEDVIHAFFPHYKWILVMSGILICLGRFGCSVGRGASGLLCLTGMLVGLIYLLKMTNTIVFTERKARSLTDRFIDLIASRYLTGQLDGLENVSVTHFIRSVGSYIAQQFESKDFSVSYTARKNALQSLISLLRCDNAPPPADLGEPAKQALTTFETGVPEGLESHSELDKFCSHCCVARLPYTNWVRQSVHHEIRLACSLWHSMLYVEIGNEAKTQLICETLLTEYNNGHQLSGTLGSGLILYLHSVYISDTRPETEDGWSKCSDLLFSMYRIATDSTAERNDILMGENGFSRDWLRKRCIELILTLEAWSFLEQCRSTLPFETKWLKKTVQIVLDAEKRMREPVVISDKMIRLYVYEAFLLYEMSPNTSLPPALLLEKCIHFQRVYQAMIEIRNSFTI